MWQQKRRLLPKITVHESPRLVVVSGCAQGWRPCMQDALTVLFSLQHDHRMDFVGVFDGHDMFGEKVAEYLALKLGPFVAEEIVKHRYENCKDVIRRSFLELDRRLLQDIDLTDRDGRLKGGSTATCIWFRDNYAIVANAGDSRAIVSINGKAGPLTRDHKPSHPVETRRIELAGGYVVKGRADGILGVSRGFGDFSFKLDHTLKDWQQKVTALPDVDVYKLSSDVDFIILASDGVWGCLTNQEVVDLVWKLIHSDATGQDIVEHILKSCIASPMSVTTKGRDNVTLLLCIPIWNQQVSEDKKVVRSTSYRARPGKSLARNEPCLE